MKYKISCGQGYGHLVFDKGKGRGLQDVMLNKLIVIDTDTCNLPKEKSLFIIEKLPEMKKNIKQKGDL